MTKIYEFKNHILIYTKNLEPSPHCHTAAHIIISMKDKMKIIVNNDEFWCQGIIIPSKAMHKVETYGNPILVFLYDSTTNVAKHIQNVQEFEVKKCVNIVSKYQKFIIDNNKSVYTKIEKDIYKLLEIDILNDCVIDDRIIAAIKYIKENFKYNITCKAVANAVFLSESRFSHLFKEQVGMTFASYLIYQRILNAYTNVISGKTVTEAALEAGFSDSAHFAGINRRVFGISIRNILKDLTYIKVK